MSKKKVDTETLLHQATRVHDVMEWIRKTVANEDRITKLEHGIDADIFSMDKLLLKRKDYLELPEMLQFHDLIENKKNLMRLEDEMTYHRNIVFKKSLSDEIRLESSSVVEELNTQFNELSKKNDQRLLEIEPEFAAANPKIYGMIVRGTKLDTLKHVLETLDRMQSGKLTANQAANIGLDYMEANGAPKGLFDFALEGPRIRNGNTVKKIKKGQL